MYQPKYSKMEVVRCLEQSAEMLEFILARGRRLSAEPSLKEGQVIAKDLSIVVNLLSLLERQVIPTLIVDQVDPDQRWQEVAREILARLNIQTAELQLHLRAPSSPLN